MCVCENACTCAYVRAAGAGAGAPGAGAHVCCAPGAGAGAGAGRGLLRLIDVQPPLNFRQTPETPEPLKKYIFYDADITSEGRKRELPGVS